MSQNQLSESLQYKRHPRPIINRSYITQQVTALTKLFIGHQSTLISWILELPLKRKKGGGED